MQKQSYGFLSDFRSGYPMDLAILVAILVTIACLINQEPTDLFMRRWHYARQAGEPVQRELECG